MMQNNVFLQGNCYEVLKTLPAESVHCCVTSPPYWMLRDYGIPPVLWPAASFSPMPGLPGMTIPEMECCYGLENDIWAYIGHTVLIFREVKRVLRDDGTLWLNIGDSYCTTGGTNSGDKGLSKKYNGIGKRLRNRIKTYDVKIKDLYGIPWRINFALQADGWYARQDIIEKQIWVCPDCGREMMIARVSDNDIIWEKPAPIPEGVTDRCTKSHEYIFLLSKSKKYHFDQEAILEECSPATHSRVSQNIEKQKGSARAHGGAKTMKAVIREQKNLKRDKPHTFHKDRIKSHTDFSDYTWGKVTKRNKRSVWTVSSRGFSGAHFAVFPETLVIPCILAGCPPDGVVLDPFSGAGTTALVSRKLGRNYVSIEIKPEYVEMAQTRLREEIPLFEN